VNTVRYSIICNDYHRIRRSNTHEYGPHILNF